MANYNKVLLMGNLTRDPEIKYTQSGTAVTKIGLAVNRRIRDAATDQWRDEPDFINCVMFGRRAEVLSEYFRKGSPIFIEGRLNYRSWETPQGERRSTLEVVAENFEFLTPRGGGSGPQDDYDSQRGGGGSSSYQGGSGSSSSYQGGGSRPQSQPPQSQPPQSQPPQSQPPQSQPPQSQPPPQPAADEMPPYDESSFADDDVPF